MSFEEPKFVDKSSSQVSTPDSSSSRSGATQICGFEVAPISLPKVAVHRRVNSGELAVKGTSLLSRQLRSPASSSEECSPSPRLRIRTPRRRLSKELAEDFASQHGAMQEEEAWRSESARAPHSKPAAVVGRRPMETESSPRLTTVDTPVGTILIHSL